MSFDATKWAWSVCEQCETTSELAVLLALADSVNTDHVNSCFPSQEDIARRTRMSTRGVRNALKALEEAKLISREKRPHNSDLITLAFKSANSVVVTGKSRQSGRNRVPPNQEDNQEPIQESLPDPPQPAGNKTDAPVLALVVGGLSPERQAFDLWNEMAARAGLPKADKLTDGRLSKIRARLKDSSLAVWREAVLRVECSSFCRGNNDRQWTASLDFLLQASSYQKVLDGNYRADLKPGQGYDARTRPSRGQLETDATLQSLHRAFAAGGDEDF